MREINTKKITEAVKSLCLDANFLLPKDVWEALEEARREERSKLGREVLDQIMENDRLAEKEKIPMCQDTGLAVVFLEIGQDVHITGGNLTDAVNQGVREGYKEGYLRKSVVTGPLERKNTQDNTPAIIHTEIVSGDKIKITVLPKGGGAENMSQIAMLSPFAGVKGVKKFIIDVVKKAGPNPCPPVVVGVGIGGGFDGAAYLAKKSLLRKLNSHHPEKIYADLEKELVKEINNLGIGPQGFGGKITALAVLIETGPCHITSIPVAVNMQCHACRRKTAVI
ncbi:MAG: fumarate hydratase [Elusimicrobia bacterium]|nr:fumarate hydratase [Elusimicrobiota bacterium]